MWYKPCWGLKAPRMSASCIKILVCDRECRRPYHIFQLIIAAFIIIIMVESAPLQSKQAALRKFLMKLLTIKKLHTLSPGPVFGVRTWLRDEHFTDDGWQYIIEISEMNTLSSPQDSSDQRLGVIIRLKQSDRADIFTRDVKLIITRPDTCYGVFNYLIESAKLALTISVVPNSKIWLNTEYRIYSGFENASNTEYWIYSVPKKWLNTNTE